MSAHVVELLLVPGVHLLDVAGPAQVFSAAADLGAPYELRYLAMTASVPTAQGAALTALAPPWPTPEPVSTVLIPGWKVGEGTASRRVDPELLERIRSAAALGGRIASVCAGAFALAAAGVLDGRRATTHHRVQDELAREFPAVQVVPDVLHVSDGDVHTSAGIASGIDLALHVVSLDHGPAFAAQVARSLVVPARRNGAQAHESPMLRYRDHLADLVHRAQDLIDSRYAEALTLDDLAGELAVSVRTLTRAFVDATGLTPTAYRQQIRMAQAGDLHSQGASWEQAAVAVGFSDARTLRRLRERRS